jgi:hypothetical protein
MLPQCSIPDELVWDLLCINCLEWNFQITSVSVANSHTTYCSAFINHSVILRYIVYVLAA